MAEPQTKFEQIIEALGIVELPPDEQEAALLQVSELVFRNTIMRMLEVMDEPTKEAFGKLVEGDASEDQLQAFLAEHVPDSDRIVMEVVDGLASDILATTTS